MTLGIILVVLAAAGLLAWLVSQAKRAIRREKAQTFGFLVGAFVDSISGIGPSDLDRSAALRVAQILGGVGEDCAGSIVAAIALRRAREMTRKADDSTPLVDRGGEHVRALGISVIDTTASESARVLADRALQLARGSDSIIQVEDFSDCDASDLIAAQYLLERKAIAQYSQAIEPRLFG